ncbi:MAG: hypothetical protein PWP64_784 [Candidatus Cloacimonadota bacterium]|nr:hypothetical protein [Candidatus Cloacimonadota bacterium]
MGTQQILLIVLSVIIVGAAIAVGIQMFNNQAYSANKTAIAADAQSYASQVVQYYKTPTSQGGLSGDLTGVIADDIGSFIGWGGATLTDNENGDYKVVPDATNNKVSVYGLGKEEKGGNKPAVRTTITFPEGSISAQVIDVSSTTTVSDIETAGFAS